MIGEGMRAYTIRMTDIAGVGGHALPGDRVDVMLMRDMSGENEQRFLTDVVLQNVKLLGVNLNTDQASTAPAAPSTATVEVSVEDAQKLAMAADLGTLSLVLRRAGEAEQEIMRPLPVTELGVIGTPVRRAAGGASAAASPASPSVPRRPGGGLIVTHGDARALVEVPSERGA
jgi:pilus assembly protein CpaB